MGRLSLGDKIKFYRQRAGISQVDLEIQINAASGTISRIESNQINPTKETLIKLIDALDINTYDAASFYDLDTEELAKLVKISKKISILNTDQILQNSVNEIALELGLLGSIIFLTDGERVFSKTLTQSWYTQLIFRMIRQPFSSLSASLIEDKYQNNYIVRSINDNKIYLSDSLTDFAYPVLPKKVTNLLQRVTGHKSAISIPIVSEEDNKAIGAILFSKNYKDNFSKEIPILQAFSEHIAAAIINAEKFKLLKEELNKLKNEK